MAAKKRKLSILLAIVALFASSSAFASIPRSEILEPPAIDFRQVEVVDVDASIDNDELLTHALDRSFIASAPVRSLLESRVWVSRLERPLFHEEQSPLSRSLHRGSAVAWPKVASGVTVLTPDPLGYVDSANLYAFCGGDPVNKRDPTGLFESDMHFHMTYYLSRRAGFSHAQALRIAEGTEAPDQDDRRPIMNGVKSLLGPTMDDRLEGSYNLWQWHFPKAKETQGEVIPGSKEARMKVFSGLIRGDIKEFGEGLHPFQDSWSHSGEPTIVGAGGHSGGYFSKDGLRSHAPDYTSTQPAKALEAAEETFRFLLNYAESFPAQRGKNAPPAAKWDDIRTEVLEYMALDTVEEKQDWMKQHGSFIDTYWGDLTLDPSEAWRKQQAIEADKREAERRRLAVERQMRNK